MIFEKYRYLIISFIFLVVTVFLFGLDIEREQTDNFTAKYIASSPINSDVDEVIQKNPSKKHTKPVEDLPEFEAQATIHSSYFENKGKSNPEKSINDVETTDKSNDFINKKSNDSKNSSSSLQLQLFSSFQRGKKGASSVFAQNKAGSYLLNAKTSTKPPMKVGGDDDPGEPPAVPIDDGIWLLLILLGGYSFHQYKRKQKRNVMA
ncbi:hypothetical protein TRIP_D380053 [uncultured Paludibacter sp.]|nr:hypothetical protein TRIP_D380053 [uncultured Paludibacter sp.]